MRIECPICKKVLVDAPDDFGPRPFCSTPCKMIDLGNWLSEAYRIPVARHDDLTDVAVSGSAFELDAEDPSFS
jgi:endogenous inhibitor of DNA gyrase (YacG/DUF329 family)